MKDNFYIIQNGTLKRKENTVYFTNENIRKIIPIEKIHSVYCLGEISINSKLLTYLSRKNIILHFFNYYGYYTGSFYPRDYLVSGDIIVKQVKHYLDPEERIFIAKEIVSSTIYNILRILEHYRKHNKDIKSEILKIRECDQKINSAKSIEELMQIEGESWRYYYQTFSKILNFFEFQSRVRRPPDNEINCLISFLNSLLYTAVLTELYHTQLNPSVSYLHEPFVRRFSLALDISEMFKPLIVGRCLFNLINKRIIKEENFRKDLNSCLLNDSGKRIVLKEFDGRLSLTVDHPSLKRRVSYKRLFRLEGYKLVKHCIGDTKYKGFRMWW
ncbi:MAG: subtype I-B CRISPR-associated endonuclease Cas1 [Deltaproteobacteria bacterium]|nr:MAG: subtype I-B CRISPR-associated endonuclease Cas1 [Deltaproteobacteria bacterium]